MGKTIFSTLILVLTVCSSYAQKKSAICSYYGISSNIVLKDICDQLSFVSNAGAERTIDDILRQVGLERNFIIMECGNIDNCLAVNLPGEIGSLRYIIYDKAFLNRVHAKTGTDWAAISILAHEIGHHLQGHTLDGLGSRPKSELQADKFSGFVLRKLGSSLKEAQAAIEELQSIEGSATHPPKIDRLNAIASGWQNANLLSSDPGFSAQQREVVSTPSPSISLDTYHRYMKDGAIAYQKKQIEKSLTYFQYASDHFQTDTLAALYGGIAAQNLQKLDLAIVLFNRYITAGGNDPSVFYGLAQIYKGKKHFDEAIYTLQMGLGRSINNVDLKAEIVNVLLSSGKENEAIDKLEDLVRSSPMNVQHAINLAILYDNSATSIRRQISELEAQLGFDKNLKKDYESELSKLEVFDGEFERIKKMISKNPKDKDLKLQLEAITQAREKVYLKIMNIEAKMSSGIENANINSVQNELINLKNKLSNLEKRALAGYHKVLSIDPSNYDALYNLGVYYFNEAVNLKSEVDNMSMSEYQTRGRKVESLVCGKFDKARPYFEKAIRVTRSSSEAQDNLRTVNSVLAQFRSKNIPCIPD